MISLDSWGNASMEDEAANTRLDEEEDSIWELEYSLSESDSEDGHTLI